VLTKESSGITNISHIPRNQLDAIFSKIMSLLLNID